MKQVSEVLLPNTDLDVLDGIKVPDDASIGDLVSVVDVGGGEKGFDTVPAATIIGGPYIPTAEKGAANGVATLGSDSKIPLIQLPAIAINDVFDAASEAAMLALTAEKGDMARRTDESNKLYVLAGTGDPTVLGNWLPVAAGVVSGGASRTSTVITTGVIAAGGQETGSFTAPKGSVVFGVKDLALKAARIRLYGAAAARDADVARSSTTDAVAGSYPAGTGLSLDIVLAGDTAYALDCDPKPVIGNPASPPVATGYYTIDNLTGDYRIVSIELHHTPIES